MRKHTSIARTVIMLLLFSSAIFTPTGLILSSQTLPASQQVERDAPSTPIDIELELSNAPPLGIEAQLICLVKSKLDAPHMKIQVELPKGFTLVSGDTSWFGDILADRMIEMQSAIRAVQVGDWTIQAQAESSENSLFQDVEELHVFVLEDAAYIDAYPIDLCPLEQRLENPPAMDKPLSSDQGIVPELPQPYVCAPNSPGTLTVTGRYWCYISQDSLSGHTSDTMQPRCWGAVYIYRASDDAYLGSDITGPKDSLGEGYFSIPIENPGFAGFYVITKPWTTACHVVRSDDSDYEGQTGPFYPSSSQTTYDIGDWNVPDQWDYKGAWRIYESIAQDHYDRGAWDFMANEGPGYVPPQVKVRFKMPDGHGTHIHLDQGIIDIDTEAFSKALDIAQHEYGHWVMYNAYSGYWPPNASGEHSINRISNPNMAWTEGWADFFPLACQSYGRWEDSYFEWGTGGSYDLETCPDCDSGDQCEGRVAGALWDVFDSHVDGSDTFEPDGFLNIWDVVSSQTDNNYRDFFNAWYSMGKDRHLLNVCSYDNTMDYNSPPALTDGQILPLPDPIYPDTELVFWVYYKDVDHDHASIVRVYIYDSGWNYYSMDHYSGDPATGEWFYKPLSGFSLGCHDYFFYATDDMDEDYDPDSGYHRFCVTEPSKPDLIISDISWSPSSPKECDTMTFTVYIKNQGESDTSPWGPFDVQYYIDEKNLGEWIIDNIPAGNTISRQFTWHAVACSHTVSAYADHGGFIPESNENNNKREEHFQVKCVVHFQTNPIEDYLTITFDGATYKHCQEGIHDCGNYMATANAPSGYTFHHWEYSGSSGSGVYVPNININPTTVEVRGNGWLKAVFCALITFHVNPPDGGTIKYDGDTLHDGDFFCEPNLPPDYGNVRTITAIPADCYEFDHWETTGRIYLSDPYSQTTTLRVEGPGELHVHFRAKGCTVTFYTDPSEGFSITFDGATYTNGQSDIFDCGTYTATANPAECYEFDHWESGENVVVTDPNVNPTSVEVKCGGWLKAVFRLIRCEVIFYTDPTDPSFNITFNSKTYTSSQSDMFDCGTSGPATANPPESWEFDYWKVSGNVYVKDTYANPTNVTIECGGTLTAVFKPVECEVTFHTDPSDVGSITFEGKTYTNGQRDSFKNGTSSLAIANAPTCWEFDYWLTSGNVSVSDRKANPTNFTVSCGGNLTASFKRLECEVTFYTDPSNGSISFLGEPYKNNQTDIFYCGTSGLAIANAPEGWNFSHWMVSGNVYVSDDTTNPTNVTIKCGGNLTAVFTHAPTLFLDPSEVIGQSIGENLTLTLRLDQINDLYAWTVDVEWDSTKLQYISAKEGDCLKRNPAGCGTMFLLGTVTAGKIEGMMCTLMGDPATCCVDIPPAPDDLASITFKVLNYTCEAGTWINITSSQLKSCTAENIDHAVRNSKFTLCPTDLVILDVRLPYSEPKLYANITEYPIGIRIMNNGSANAGPFNVSFSAFWEDGMILDYFNKTRVDGLEAGKNMTIDFYFMPRYKGNYTITTIVDCDDDVAESNEENNTRAIDVSVRIAGDLDGDGDVDFEDIVAICMAYSSKPGDPNWNEQADLDADGYVDFDDVVTAAMNYGKSDC